MENYTIFSGNTPTFSFTVTDSDGSAVNLTDATVKFTAADKADAAATAWSETCTVDDAEGGLCHCDLAAEDTATPGEYDAELNIEWSSGKILTSARFAIKIKRTMTV